MNRDPFPLTFAEYRSRIARTTELLGRQGWDALLCYASAVIPGHVRYLTGYETRLRIHDACYLLLTPGADPEVTLFTNASWEHPEEFSWVQNVVVTSAFGAEIAARLPQSVLSVAAKINITKYSFLFHNFRSLHFQAESINMT